MLDVIRGCLLGGLDEEEAKEDRVVLLVSESRIRLDPRPLPLSWSLVFPPLPLLPLDLLK